MQVSPPQSFCVDAANAGRRLDTWLRQTEPRVPLAALMRWLRLGRVRIDRHRVKGSARLSLGQTVTWPGEEALLAAEASAELGPAHATLLRERKALARSLRQIICYEDENLLVVNKPALLTCHAGTNHEGGLMAWVEAYLGTEQRKVGHRPGLVQRLDRGVSGLVPIGKTAAALRLLGALVEQQQLVKTYLALVEGEVVGEAGILDAPLVVGDEPMGDRPRTFVAPEGKPAVTHWRRLSVGRNTSLLALRLETGRTHQIRAHLLHFGHRLLGDPRYGSSLSNSFLHQTLGVARPLLHGYLLSWQSFAATPAGHTLAVLPDDFVRATRHHHPGLRERWTVASHLDSLFQT